jgi:hypothetical protein
MSLPLPWLGWAIQLMWYGVRFIDIGRTGHSDKATRARPKYRDGDEEDRASEGESLTSAPALSERCHRSLARCLIAVRGTLDAVGTVAARPHPGAARRRNLSLEDTPDHDALLQHGIIVLVIADGRTLED